MLVRVKNSTTGAESDSGKNPVCAWEYDRSLAGIAGFETRRGRESCSLVRDVCCQAELFATGRSLTQRSPTECGVSECDQGSHWKRRNSLKDVEP